MPVHPWLPQRKQPVGEEIAQARPWQPRAPGNAGTCCWAAWSGSPLNPGRGSPDTCTGSHNSQGVRTGELQGGRHRPGHRTGTCGLRQGQPASRFAQAGQLFLLFSVLPLSSLMLTVPCARERPLGAVLEDTLFAGRPQATQDRPHSLPRGSRAAGCCPLSFLPHTQPQCPQPAPNSASERMQCACRHAWDSRKRLA